MQCIRVTNEVAKDLVDIEAKLLAIEKQWQYFRENCTHINPDAELWKQYLVKQHRWHTIELPREKTACLLQINGYWQSIPGARWKDMCANLKLVALTVSVEAMLRLRHRIEEGNKKWAELKARCEAICEDLQNMRRPEAHYLPPDSKMIK